jgi:hypothetical protein
MRLKVKEWTLKKIATQFQNFKKILYQRKKSPKFTGPLEKQRGHWDEFVKYKESEEAKERSEKNKKNAAKRYFTIIWGQLATRLPFLSGMKLRLPCALKGSLRLQMVGPEDKKFPTCAWVIV